jgi:AcrR family transcriptional regulator
MPPHPSYHHGNLRPVLLDASLKLIAEVGLAAFTLREVARRAGVSHNAPYRHFRSKEELIAALAAEGFDRLAQAMREAMVHGEDPLEKFRNSGFAYIECALKWPQHFTVMFEAPLDLASYPETATAAERAFQTLGDAVATCQAEGLLPPGNHLPVALAAWSLVHGIAKLAIAERLPFSSRQAVLHFAGFAMSCLQHGIGGASSASKQHHPSSPKKKYGRSGKAGRPAG